MDQAKLHGLLLAMGFDLKKWVEKGKYWPKVPPFAVLKASGHLTVPRERFLEKATKISCK